MARTSVVIDIDEYKIEVIASNTGKTFFLPSYLRQVMSERSWNEERDSGYLRGKIFRKDIRVHHLVVGCPLKGYVVDHIDGNKNNNLPDNLRVVTHSINLLNINHFELKNRYKGVYFHKKNNKWVSQIRVGKEMFNLGSYNLIEEAAITYYNTKFNLFGYEFMTEFEKHQYRELLDFLQLTEWNIT